MLNPLYQTCFRNIFLAPTINVTPGQMASPSQVPLRHALLYPNIEPPDGLEVSTLLRKGLLWVRQVGADRKTMLGTCVQ